jgi:hypothetical protein
MKINFNESLLEEWNDLLIKMIGAERVEAKRVLGQQELARTLPIAARLPRPASTGRAGNYLLSIESNACDVYDLKLPL